MERLRAGVGQFRGYRLGWLRGDVAAGLTVAAYLVPQVMAYSTLARLPPITGLWAAIVALAAYLIFGSSRHLSVGPESTTALMTAAVLAPFAVGDGARYAALAAALAILVGAICFVAALVRLGILANLLSRPVLIGYMTGIALVMMVSQLGTITGAPVSGDRFIDLVLAFAHNVSHVHRPRTVLAASVLVMLLALDRRAPKMPGPGGAGSHGCCSGGHSVWAPR